MATLLIRGGRVIDPAQDIDRIADLRIVEFVEKPKDPAVISSLVLGGNARARLADKSDQPYCLASMGIYLFSGKVMREALADHTQTDFGKEVIPGLLASKRMMAYVFDGYWEDIGTVGSFWECNLTLTDPVPPFDFFDGQNPVYTHARYLPPAKLNGARSPMSFGMDAPRRYHSPVLGGSSLITCAPACARSIVLNGPATMWVQSITRIPSSGNLVM